MRRTVMCVSVGWLLLALLLPDEASSTVIHPSPVVPLTLAGTTTAHNSNLAVNEQPIMAQPSALTSAGMAWDIQCVDCPKFFSDMDGRSLRLDAEDRPHIAYGGDHLYYARHDGVAWHWETVDSAGGVGRYASLALGTSGHPHISYYDKVNDDLKYAYWTGDAWDIQTVDVGGTLGVGNVGRHTSLALDSADRPHISYFDYTHYKLKYARWTGSAWEVQTVDSMGWDPDLVTSLALDTADHPHISYKAGGCGLGHCDFELRYAYWTGITWDIQVVASGRDVGACASLVLDAAGHPHISYSDDHPNLNLKYAHWTGDAWDIQIVDDGGGCGSLALDASGNPHIGYAGGGLKYAYRAGENWEIQVLGDEEGEYISLALDAVDHPHMGYFDAANHELKYVYWTGSAWDTQNVDGGGAVGVHNSLALNAFGYPHISYFDSANDDLKYARWTGDAWDIQTVDADGYVGSHTFLALDAIGHPHISYSGGGPKYARWTGSTWDIQTVDVSINMSWHTSLALDGSTGNPHISYIAGDCSPVACESELRYAYWTGSAWITQTVDSEEGGSSSLALDAVGYPHISYMGHPADGYLKYARWTGSTWDIQTVDSGGDPSLVLDAAGHPHISYFSSSGLKYARWTGHAWHIQTVDSEGEGGSSGVLTLDAVGRPHIGYIAGGCGPQSCNYELRYAHWMGDAWDIQMVDAGGDVHHTSLALDRSTGYPHISYYDSATGDLKYAVGGPLVLLPPPSLTKQATPSDGLRNNEILTYTLTLTGPGLSVRLWDPLPEAVHYISGSLTSTLTPLAVYSPKGKMIVWQGLLPTDTVQVIRFGVTPGVTGTGSLDLTGPIVNTAWLADTEYDRSISATVIVNGARVFLPMIANNYDPNRLTSHPANDTHPALSNDGQSVLFLSDREGRSDVFRVSTRGRTVTNLTQTPQAEEDTPTFAPDGSAIAFASDRTGDWDIYLMDPDGTNIRVAVGDPGSDEVHPSFAPDGQRLAFSSDRAGGNWDIYTATLGGDVWTRLTRDPAADRFPSFSADGTLMAWRSERDGNSELYVMDADGSNLRRVTNDPAWDGYATFTPDGSGMTFVSTRSGVPRVYVINLAGEGLRELEGRSGWQMDTPRLSGDGRTLIYAGGEAGQALDIYRREFSSPLFFIGQQGATHRAGNCDWEAGVLAYGWIQAGRATGDEVYRDWAQAWVDGCMTVKTEITHVNDGLLGYAALVAYETSGRPEYLAFAQQVADYFMNTALRTTDGTLTHEGDTVWIDTVLGAIPFLIEMGKVSGDARYTEEAVTQVIRHAAHLQDPEGGLYHHAWDESEDRFIGPAYWGRGNGWALLADVAVLSSIPDDHPQRSVVLGIMQKQAAGLRPLQDSGGLWHTVVTRPDFYLESSASSLVGYAFKCGVQAGWLDKEAYAPAARATTLGVWRRVLADGTVTGVSAPTWPMPVEAYNDRPYDALQLYGQGLVLLLASPAVSWGGTGP